MLATLAPLRPLRLIDDHSRLLLPPYPTIHDFTPLGALALGNLLGVRSAQLVLSDRLSDGISRTGYHGCPGLAVLDAALRLIAAGQKLDCFCLVAQFGSVSIIAQATQRSASPSIII